MKVEVHSDEEEMDLLAKIRKLRILSAMPTNMDFIHRLREAIKVLSREAHDQFYFQKGLLMSVENDLHFGAKLETRGTSDLLK